MARRVTEPLRSGSSSAILPMPRRPKRKSRSNGARPLGPCILPDLSLIARWNGGHLHSRPHPLAFRFHPGLYASADLTPRGAVLPSRFIADTAIDNPCRSEHLVLQIDGSCVHASYISRSPRKKIPIRAALERTIPCSHLRLDPPRCVLDITGVQISSGNTHLDGLSPYFSVSGYAHLKPGLPASSCCPN